jgi:tetratricopeptide (TPR) repeat protein/serine/threonine protein kinase
MRSPSAVESIFFAALEKPSSQERFEYLHAACAGDPELLGRVRSMLEAQDKAGSFLEEPVYVPELIADQDAFDDRAGKSIGAYELLEQVGEGGMGSVWKAQQTQPVKRLVALKLIKAGMDSKTVIARFEAERQALALMDHPNIARVLDAGTESGGRPYFVMDLVEGVPITAYCDEHRLTLRDRLELFIPVCQAIQHAHQKGVIHRDIKPTNVMVALHDGKPVPKVIDFGVAKATEQRLTDRTLFTQHGIVVGTLEYMSPEQAEASAEGLDTRSDIYSLGVLLYELLTGSTPLTHLRIKDAAFGEILRIIKEEDPPNPSTRLNDSGAALAPISARRHVEPGKLTKLVRGELDWIVMKALEKDRNRRYESASGFALDVQRYLTHEPVMAGPPSAVYRLRKFVRRNRGTLAAVGVLATALLVAIGGVGWAVRDRTARRADVEREKTERVARVSSTVRQMLVAVDRLIADQQWPEALASVRQAAAMVADSEADAETAVRTHALLKELEFIDGLDRIRLGVEQTSEQKIKEASVIAEYRRAFQDFGADVEDLTVEAAVERLSARPALALPIAAALDHWVQCRMEIKVDGPGSNKLVAIARGIDPDPVRDRVRASWLRPFDAGEQAELLRLAGSIDIRSQHPTTLLYLARAIGKAGHLDSALALLRDAQRAFPRDFWMSYSLGLNLYNQNEFEEAVRFYTAAVSLRPNAAISYNNLGNALCRLDRVDEALTAFQMALALDPQYAMAYANFSNALSRQNKFDEALAACRKCVELDPDYALGFHSLGNVLLQLGKTDEAIDAYRKVVELDPKLASGHASLGYALHRQKKPDEALEYLHKAIEIDPDCAHAHYGLGLVLLGRQKPDEAIASFRRAVGIDSHYSAAYLSLGNALSDRNDLDGAIAAFQKTVELDPRNADAHHNLAFIFDRQHKEDEALAEYRKAVEVVPGDAGAHHNLAVFLNKHHKQDEAIPEYRKAAELDPGNADAHFLLGAMLDEQHQSEEALVEYRKAVEADPGTAMRHLMLGSHLHERGRSDEALESYRKAVELDPKFALAYGCIGDVLFIQKKPDEAEASYRKAVALDPAFDGAFVGLGSALRVQGKLAEAIAAYEEAVRLEPKSPDSAHTLARILVTCTDAKLRNAARAIELAEIAVKLDPKKRTYRNTLGVAHYRAGNWKEASVAIEQSMAMAKGGDSFDWFFLAMIHFQLGETDAARDWYSRAVEWMEGARSTNEELQSFQAEAAQLIGIEEK